MNMTTIQKEFLDAVVAKHTEMRKDYLDSTPFRCSVDLVHMIEHAKMSVLDEWNNAGRDLSGIKISEPLPHEHFNLDY